MTANYLLQIPNAAGQATPTAAGKRFVDMLGMAAEFEANLRRERQLDGIAKAKTAGIYKGRPPSIEASETGSPPIVGSAHDAMRLAALAGVQKNPLVGDRAVDDHQDVLWPFSS